MYAPRYVSLSVFLLLAMSAPAVHAQEVACSDELVAAALAPWIMDHPSGAPVLSTDASLCSQYASQPNIDAKCTQLGVAYGLVDTPLAFFANADSGGSYCGCACAEAPTCHDPATLEAILEDHTLYGQSLVVTEAGEIGVVPVAEDGSCPSWVCPRLSSTFGMALQFGVVDVAGEPYCGCTCDLCGVVSEAALHGAQSWDDLEVDPTGADVYAIATPAQLASLGSSLDALDESFVQCRDLEMADHYAPGVAPYFVIGSPEAPFTGSYDGRGHAIRSFTYRHDEPPFEGPAHDAVGLFGRAAAATIQRVRLEAVDILTYGTANTAGLAGELDGSTVSDVHIDGSVSVEEGLTAEAAGGVVGLATGSTVSDASVDMLVDANAVVGVGGIVGVGEGSTFSQCWSDGFVSGDDLVGGLAGDLRAGSELSDSFSVAEVTGADYVGGLAGGVEASTVARAYFAGIARSWHRVGAHLGQLRDAGVLADTFVVPELIESLFFSAFHVVPGPVAADAVLVDVHFWHQTPCFIECYPESQATGHDFFTPGEAIDHFSDPNHAPLSAWDFDETWTGSPGVLPTL